MATEWGRTDGPFMVVILASDPERGEVCLNSAARKLLAGSGADLDASVDVFTQLVAQQRWASAVAYLLKGLVPGRAGQLSFPNSATEAAVPSARAAAERDERAAYIITLVLPLLYVGAFGWWRLSTVGWSGPLRSRGPVISAGSMGGEDQ